MLEATYSPVVGSNSIDPLLNSFACKNISYILPLVPVTLDVSHAVYEDFNSLPLLSTKALTVFSPIVLLNLLAALNIVLISVTFLVSKFDISPLNTSVL